AARSELPEESIEFRLRQGLAAFILDGSLRSNKREAAGQLARLSIDAYLMLLHGFQTRGLSLGWRPIDLIGQHDIGEQGTGTKAELAGGRLKDIDARDVRRHQIRRELNARETALQGGGQASSE